jgi:hypothetical protein
MELLTFLLILMLSAALALAGARGMLLVTVALMTRRNHLPATRQTAQR